MTKEEKRISVYRWLREINSPKSELMRIRDEISLSSKSKAEKLDRLIEKLEYLQNS